MLLSLIFSVSLGHAQMPTMPDTSKLQENIQGNLDQAKAKADEAAKAANNQAQTQATQAQSQAQSAQAQAQSQAKGVQAGSMDLKGRLAQLASSCSQDAEATGCKSERNPRKLVKCLKDFHAKNPDYNLSPDCKTATSALKK